MDFEFRADREAHLRMLCKEMGRSVDDFVNEAVLTFMEDYEDLRDGREAKAEAEASGERYLTLQEVMEKYGLEAGDLTEGAEAVGQDGRECPQEDSGLLAPSPAKAA